MGDVIETDTEADELPGPVANPCNECPWRRDSTPGHLGPFTAHEWVAIVHSDQPIACHKTIVEGGSWAGAKQCAGSGHDRTNVMKVPRNDEVWIADEIDGTVVFGGQGSAEANAAFVEHHTGEPYDVDDAREAMVAFYEGRLS